MSFTPPMNAPQSNFQSIFNNSLRKYKKQTREDLFLHPLAAKLQSCDSPHAVLPLLQEQATDERLTSWLSPVVNAIYVLSSSLGEDANLVSYQRLFIQRCDLLTPFAGFITCKTYFCCHWCLALSEGLC